MITSTYWTLIAALAEAIVPDPVKPWLCELPPPVAAVLVAAVFTWSYEPKANPEIFVNTASVLSVCVWLGISAVVNVWPATVPVTLTEPDTTGVPNAVVNAAEPPEPAVPDTTRRALSLCVVDLVNPVGAALCTNNIAVPEGITDEGRAA